MVNFLLGFHCHQPVGNFEGVFKEVHNKSYSPLIRTLLKYDSCKFCLHISGYLLEWIVKNDPELIEIIREGVSEHKVEMLGGGYYEPVLASIPRSDRIKQLEMLNEAVKKYFGVYPKGAWITERIWQPDIIDSLDEAGISYAFLDDSQFFQSGIDSNDIDNIFITEYNGKYFNLFPIHERLRYKLPFANTDESVREILYMNERLSNLSVMIDDGEKMGSWPNTFEWVYGKAFNSENKFDGIGGNGWLNKFLTILGDPSNNIKMKLPSELIDEIPIRQPVYLPLSSYREMGEWTLPVEKRFKYDYTKEKYPDAVLAGGIWHNFFIHYPESNLLHKRMLFLSNKINDFKIKFPEMQNSINYKNAIKELFKSQANDAYWHGVFGGIYLPHLRRGVQNSLIKASVSYDLLCNELKQFENDNKNNKDKNNKKEIRKDKNKSNDYNNNVNNNIVSAVKVDKGETDKSEGINNINANNDLNNPDNVCNVSNNVSNIDKVDFDMDGELEYQARNKFWQIVYKPSNSHIIALDYLEKNMFNPFGDIFCLHDEYDIHIIKDKLNIKNNSAENKNINEDVPHTIHNNVKVPEGLTEKDLFVNNGLMPHFQLKYNGKDLNFNLKSINNNDDIIVIISEGFTKNKEENEEPKILIGLEITISDTLQYHISFNNNNKISDGKIIKSNDNFKDIKEYSNISNSNNSDNSINNKGNNDNINNNNNDNNFGGEENTVLKSLSIFFRFSFPGGDGPATYIKPDEKNIYGLRENLIDIPVNSVIEIGDSFWGGSLKAFINTNGYANYKTNEENNINLDYTPLLNYSPITTVSLYEGGSEKIFQSAETIISWDLEDKDISDIHIEWKAVKK
ncbi:MAG: alpha-amylase/4-alpha-glucanotransferase domain-containing protein [bacterium]